jgi:hypothetical protein
MASAMAARSHHGLDVNIAHAASPNRARLAMAPTFASAHAVPAGGSLVPASHAVIHQNVLAYASSIAAATLRRVHRLRPSRHPAWPLLPAFWILSATLLLDRIAPHLTGGRATL